jgi:integrase
MRIYQRAGVWYYVRRVPADVAEVFDRPIVTRSLRTTEKKKAKSLAAGHDAQMERIIMVTRGRVLPKDRIKKLVAEYLAGALDRFEDVLMMESVNSVDELTVDMLREKAKQGVAEYKADVSTEFLKAANHVDGKFLTADFDAVKAIGNTLASNDGLALNQNERERLYRELLSAQSRLFNALAARVNGDYVAFDLEKQKADAERKKNYITFGQLISEFEKFESKRRAWKPKTLDQFRAESALLLELIGDIDISEVNRRDTINDCWTVLQKYPSNRRKKYRDTPLKDILRNKNYDVIDARTINRHMGRLSDLIRFSIKEELLDSNTNHAEGKQIQIKRLPIDEREPFDKNDIQKLVNAICTQKITKPDRFLALLVALFQGFRPSEIYKLANASIIEQDGIACFDLLSVGAGNSKTKAGRRIVPIHEKLIEFGFVRWAGTKKGKLFYGTSDNFGDWFNRNEASAKGFKVKHVTTEPKKVLYSFRHSFSDELKRAGVEEHKVVSLQENATSLQHMEA